MKRHEMVQDLSRKKDKDREKGCRSKKKNCYMNALKKEIPRQRERERERKKERESLYRMKRHFSE